MSSLKKYFSIAEASDLTGLPHHKLRYIEKTDPDLEITKVRNRRYYTSNSITYLNDNYTGKKIKEKVLNTTDFNDHRVITKNEVIVKEEILPNHLDHNPLEQLSFGIDFTSNYDLHNTQVSKIEQKIKETKSLEPTKLEHDPRQQTLMISRIDTLLDKLNRLAK
ncbi:MAG: MerR family transcriptional regulator [Rickettsiales bacterium]|nr:MerR family transcriptional regulator [Rickettsiales bacterium]